MLDGSYSFSPLRASFLCSWDKQISALTQHFEMFKLPEAKFGDANVYVTFHRKPGDTVALIALSEVVVSFRTFASTGILLQKNHLLFGSYTTRWMRWLMK